MTQLNFDVVTKEALGGQQTGNLVVDAVVIKEVLVGDTVGYAGPFATPSVVKDVLIGMQVGSLEGTMSVIKDVLVGQDVGLDLFPSFMHTIKEVIGRDSSYKFTHTIKEVLISAPDDRLRQSWVARTDRQIVSQHRAEPLPVDVWSYTGVGSMRELVVVTNVRQNPISVTEVRTLQRVSISRRASAPPAEVLSELRFKTLRQVVTMSRSIPYNPVSGNFTYTMRQIATQRRVKAAPVDVQSPTSVRTLRQIVVHSRRAATWDAATLVQIVVRGRITTFPQPTRAATLQQITAQHRDTPAPNTVFSSLEAATLFQGIVSNRATPGIIWSDEQVGAFTQVAVQHRDTAMLYSPVYAGTLAQVAVQRRSELVVRPSDLYVGQQVQVVTMRFTPGALPYTGMDAATLTEVVTIHRETAPPNAISSWDVKVLSEIAVQHRTTSVPRGYIHVKTQRVQYVLGAVYPPPGEVIGPELGAQVKQQRQIAVQSRIYEDPQDATKRARKVTQIGEQLVVADTFEDKQTPHSDADVFSMAQQVAIGGDVFPDPMQAFGDAIVLNQGQVVVVGDDVFLDPRVPQSNVDVIAFHEAPILGDDVFPDPNIPASDATVFTVGVATVLGDTDLPDPQVPVSDAKVRSLALVPVLGDVFTDPQSPQSPVDAFALAQVFVMLDPTLRSIPARTNRRRAVITVSMS